MTRLRNQSRIFRSHVDSLPKTRSGKIMRRVLKARALGHDPGNISTLEE
jgi:acetyl-CoA synthetase